MFSACQYTKAGGGGTGEGHMLSPVMIDRGIPCDCPYLINRPLPPTFASRDKTVVGPTFPAAPLNHTLVLTPFP